MPVSWYSNANAAAIRAILSALAFGKSSFFRLALVWHLRSLAFHRSSTEPVYLFFPVQLPSGRSDVFVPLFLSHLIISCLPSFSSGAASCLSNSCRLAAVAYQVRTDASASELVGHPLSGEHPPNSSDSSHASPEVYSGIPAHALGHHLRFWFSSACFCSMSAISSL